MHIRQLHVKNYRSLKDVSIGDLSRFVVLYGENDSGKSNILSFLEHVFSQKYIEEVTDVPQEIENIPIRRPTGFWRGEITNFSDNFYRNSSESIDFSILIEFKRREILTLIALPPEFLEKLPDKRDYDLLKIEGQIVKSASADRAEMILHNAEFNQKSFYDSSLSENSRYLPYFKLDPGQALDIPSAR